MEYDNDIRYYLNILEYYSSNESAPMLVEEVAEIEDCSTERLTEIVFKLRSYSDPTGGDYSLGYEQGLELAAQMIENLVKTMVEQSGS